ncbi:hypothetical protein AB1Y20_021558 [Prymnesium parvum]|uniref:Uncharacterized protein n=1 Tax=Prymnesium parvum TaxID=97485 RepID=A0AB34JLK2_PRYPA
MWRFARARARASPTDYHSMECDASRVQPLTSGTSRAPPPPPPPLHARLSRLRGRLARIVRPRPTADGGVDELRMRWAAEKAALLAELAASRGEAERAAAVAAGWEALSADLLYYGAVAGRAAELTEWLTQQLHGSLSEVEGVQEAEVADLTLPSASEYSPRLQLLKYHAPELSEWQVSWEPPPAMARAEIVLRGRKFGVSFSIGVTIRSLRLNGTLQCKWSPHGDRPTLSAGFKRMPEVGFDIALAGKALSLGSETLRAWLHRQVERALKEKVVLPKAVSVELPLFRGVRNSTQASTPRIGRALLALRVDSHAGPCWELDERLARALGAPLWRLESRKPAHLEGASARWQWGTTLVLAMLQLRYHDRANAWSSLVEVRRNGIGTELMRCGMEVVCDLNLMGL